MASSILFQGYRPNEAKSIQPANNLGNIPDLLRATPSLKMIYAENPEGNNDVAATENAILQSLARVAFACFTGRVKLPYKVATLLYCFNEQDEILLLERAQEPNRGFWSPCGGKLHTDEGESPYACACREALEEACLQLAPRDLHLTGLISEHGYQGHTHWLMFLFEVKPKLKTLPALHAEGRFQFFPRTALDGLKLPQTDREKIWPWFWEHRGGFFAAHCHCHPDGRNDWTLEDSRMVKIQG